MAFTTRLEQAPPPVKRRLIDTLLAELPKAEADALRALLESSVAAQYVADVIRDETKGRVAPDVSTVRLWRQKNIR